MGLFDQIVRAIDNPDLQASASQLGGIVNTVQQLSSNQGVSSSETQKAMALVGSYVRAALKQPDNDAQALVNRYSGTDANAGAVNALFSDSQQQQIVQEISQRTGMNANTIQSLLPILVPLVLNLLNSGSTTRGQGSNPVLGSFLDSDGDGDVDVADALQMAGQFLGQRR